MAEMETPSWDWFVEDAGAGPDPAKTDRRELSLLFARCFSGEDGHQVLAHLRAITTERVFGATAPDCVLRHAEGQRQLVSYIAGLVERGRQGGA